MKNNKIYLFSLCIVIMLGVIIFCVLGLKNFNSLIMPDNNVDKSEMLTNINSSEDKTEASDNIIDNDNSIPINELSASIWTHQININDYIIELPMRFDQLLSELNATCQTIEDSDIEDSKNNINDYSWVELTLDNGTLIDVYIKHLSNSDDNSTKYVMGIQQSFNEDISNVILPGGIRKGFSKNKVIEILGNPNDTIHAGEQIEYRYYNPDKKTYIENDYISVVLSDGLVDYVMMFYDGTNNVLE